jgi:hypothetical protein
MMKCLRFPLIACEEGCPSGLAKGGVVTLEPYAKPPINHP